VDDRFFDDGDGINGEALALLRTVLVELCHSRDLTTDCDEARRIAVSLIALFKSGFRSRAELLFMAE
jgi:hypothetical protein